MNTASSPPHIAYIMSRFPKITETFILHEISALYRKRWNIDIYPLLRHRDPTIHPEVEDLLTITHYLPFLSLHIIVTNLRVLISRPLRYIGTLIEVFGATLTSPNFFIGALGIFPKTVCFALDMERRGVEHIHAHFANHPALAALIIHRLTSIPFSFTAHGSDLHVDQTMLARKVEAASFVVTISEYNRRFIEKRCPRAGSSKVHVIPCGLDCAVFTPCPEQPRSGIFRILCVAAFRKVKGHRYLLEACRILRQRGYSFECVLIGSYELENEIRRLIRQFELEPYVRMEGPQPRPMVIRSMCAADVIALTSIRTRKGHREGIPVVLMEAMASARPVVASNLSGIPELVENGRTGLLTTPGCPDEIADALEKLLRNPGLRFRMGIRGRRKVVEQFNQDKTILQLMRLFNRSVREHRAAEPAAEPHCSACRSLQEP